jgi:hypothetical protein
MKHPNKEREIGKRNEKSKTRKSKRLKVIKLPCQRGVEFCV